jgi:hypothetical protein
MFPGTIHSRIDPIDPIVAWIVVHPVDSRELIPTYRTAALCSEVWQKRKRTSRRDFVKAYFAAVMAGVVVGVVFVGLLSEAAEERTSSTAR